MSKQEKIVCPAIALEIEKCGDRFEVEICDASHDLIRKSWAFSELSFADINIEHLGFRTSTGRFVDAKEAMSIAINNNQIKELEDLHTRWIMWQLAGDERWKDVRECWRELKINLESRELKPEDLY